MIVVWNLFPNHVLLKIGGGGDFPWRARSPDMFACDNFFFFFVGYLKAKVI